jgi:hypothetical protein
MLEETNALVLDALLWNPRLTEQDLLVTVNSPSTSADTLSILSRHPRWSSRYGIRVALARNPRTPLSVSLAVLTSLTERDLLALADMSETPNLLKLASLRVLEDTDWRRRQAADGA